MNRLFSTSLLCLATCGCFAPGFGQSTEGSGSEASAKEKDREKAFTCASPDKADAWLNELLQAVNRERAAEGLPPVRSHPGLDHAASDYACKMIAEQFFSHRDPATGDGPGHRAISVGYSFLSVGENLAAGQATPAEAMKEWMGSSAHRNVILDSRWRDFGAAVRIGGEFGIYWVQLFGDAAGAE